jgi:hypothetical protein
MAPHIRRHRTTAVEGHQDIQKRCVHCRRRRHSRDAGLRYESSTCPPSRIQRKWTTTIDRQGRQSLCRVRLVPQRVCGTMSSYDQHSHFVSPPLPPQTITDFSSFSATQTADVTAHHRYRSSHHRHPPLPPPPSPRTHFYAPRITTARRYMPSGAILALPVRMQSIFRIPSTPSFWAVPPEMATPTICSASHTMVQQAGMVVFGMVVGLQQW